MKTLQNSTSNVRLPWVTIGSLIFLSSAAFATDDNLKFRAADLDSSGTLSLAEFRTTLSSGAPEDQVLKKFSRADANDDKSVTQAEWIAYKNNDEDGNDIQEDTARFNAADANDDGFLSYDEFSSTLGKKRLIDIRKRFLKADKNADSQISLSEWLAYKNDDSPEVDSGKFRKFDLADLDGSDDLTLKEFKSTYPRKTKLKTILKKFKREDSNDDNVLTREEWNPGKGKKG
jgi:Ca2+-binding EF-hand superfamily protein